MICADLSSVVESILFRISLMPKSMQQQQDDGEDTAGSIGKSVERSSVESAGSSEYNLPLRNERLFSHHILFSFRFC